VKSSTAAAFLAQRRVDLRLMANIDECYDALAKRKVTAVVYDAPVLQYHTTQDPGSNEKLVGRLFQRQNYGFGLQQGSQYRKQINEATLALKENGFFDELQQKWFGERD
jgi:ABC-type amino acid transport substrate-binding protein